MKKTVVILSGGMDSATLTYWLVSKGHEVHALTFDYGQKHCKEIEAAKKIAEKPYFFFGHDVESGGIFSHIVVHIPQVGVCLTSALTSGWVEVPEGHYDDEAMKQTVVPMRNTIMLAIAVGYAQSIGAQIVAYAAHGGDHPIYPDCRPEFVQGFNEMLKSQGVEVSVLAPFISLDKVDILRLGVGLGVPYELTWSCYKGEEIPCGKCGTCEERKEAFHLLRLVDPLVG